ncbi:MAG TPA: aspartate/glutamate racemase family protein [Pyrinomonadaceae bacterium]|jgi:aspartate racemase
MTSSKEKQSRPILGIIGGLGPLASSEFLKTIYEYTLNQQEQGAPFVMMYSDPSFPDRTEALLNGQTDLMLAELLRALERLNDLGASKFVICCVTMHHLLPRLPARFRTRLLSLLDIIFAEVLLSGKKHLLLCSSGTRQLQIFQNHDLWKHAHDYFVLPEEQDQKAVHELIYQIKRNYEVAGLAPAVEALLAKYKVSHFVAGCTEFHLLAKYFARAADEGRRGCRCLDPLTIIAKRMAEDKIPSLLRS